MYVLNSLLVRPAGNAPRQVRRRYSFLADVFPWLLFGLAEIFVLIYLLPWIPSKEYTAIVVKLTPTLDWTDELFTYEYTDLNGTKRSGKWACFLQPIQVGDKVNVHQSGLFPTVSRPTPIRNATVRLAVGLQLVWLLVANTFGMYAWLRNEFERRLLVHGRTAEAVVKNVLRRGVHWDVDYEFTSGEAVISGKADLEPADSVQVAKGTQMTVFFDPEQPSRHCLYVTSRYVIEMETGPGQQNSFKMWEWFNAPVQYFGSR